MTASIQISLNTHHPAGRTSEPVTCGVPFPKGLLFDPTRLKLSNSADVETLLQVRVLDRWPDQSVRWALCDFSATIEGSEQYCVLTIGEPSSSSLSEFRAKPISEGEAETIVMAIGGKLISAECLCAETPDDLRHETMPDYDWFIEDSGPTRICVRESGMLEHAGRGLATYTIRAHYFAATRAVRVHLTIGNPNRAEHPGGCWDLGDSGSILIRDVSVRFPTSENSDANPAVSVEPGSEFLTSKSRIELYQDSSGGENWMSTNHISRKQTVPIQFRGYQLQCDDTESTGLRATPIIRIGHDSNLLVVSVPAFWQNFPKALEADAEGITLRLFPRQSAEPHELQGGEQKTHVFYVCSGPDPVTDEPLRWTRDPIVAVVDPAWIASTGAIPYLTTRADDPHAEYLRLTDAAIEGPESFERKREVIDEYGWRHFGDMYGDHEAILHEDAGVKPRNSHYNNQYDCIAGFAIQWLRSGDVRWRRQMRELALHVRDIDIYNTDADKAAYNHGLFWHTYHYVDADTGTHRSYPKAGRIPPHGKPVPGGGPGNEQNYATGLMLDYFLTGDEMSKEATVGLAQWVIDMDDGRKTVFRILSTADTGLASASRTPDYHGPGRGAANSVAALLDGHRLTGDRKFLQKAEQLIRRVIHPNDDVTRIVGIIRDNKVCVDAENRWFYVMFLQALGKYLDYKAELGEVDECYGYAQASLLRYARWMADHEYPYLDRPELLEYPTETWPAQDLRKSEVFDYAAMHTRGAERDRFRERADFFYKSSIETLAKLPTRTLCRPVVLLMTNGWRRSWFAKHPVESRPIVEAINIGQPTKFVPQKRIALHRAKRIIVLANALGGILLIGFIAWAFGMFR